MRLFNLAGATSLMPNDDDIYEADEDGCFDIPQDLAMQLHSIHILGQKVWETEGERQNRLLAEELKRRQDPATLLAAVEALTAKVAPDPEPVRRTRAKTT